MLVSIRGQQMVCTTTDEMKISPGSDHWVGRREAMLSSPLGPLTEPLARRALPGVFAQWLVSHSGCCFQWRPRPSLREKLCRLRISAAILCNKTCLYLSTPETWVRCFASVRPAMSFTIVPSRKRCCTDTTWEHFKLCIFL